MSARLDDLVAALSRPAAYPHPVVDVRVIHTHISVVFLAGEFAYKIKKPVNFGFLDFSTLERRWHFCEEEVRLNRRLAPAVYLGVVGVTQDGGGARFGGTGEAIEYAVRMRRLPVDRTLEALLARGALDTETLRELGRRLAAFHAAAEGGPRVAAFGRLDVVAGNARENFRQCEPCAGRTVSAAVLGRLRELTERALVALAPLIEARAARHVPRDTHGDLHLDHVYLLEDGGGLAIVDCIEFNVRFRFADPVADAAFLAMDLRFHGRPDLARAFLDAYFQAAGDEEGRALAPFYEAYRAIVRGKVEGFELDEAEIPAAERDAALRRARAHFLLALGELAPPAERPCLLLVAGLPGTGKSTLALELTRRAGMECVASDAVRKELARALGPAAPQGPALYTPEWNDRTYAACRERAVALLFAGRRVQVDANFKEESRRREFLDAARGLCVPALILHCTAGAEDVRGRLDRRRDGATLPLNASDADWSVYLYAAERWEDFSPASAPLVRPLDTGGPPEASAAEAIRVLTAEGLALQSGTEPRP